MREKRSSRIPTEEEFAKAKAAMEEDDRGLSEVSLALHRRFEESGLRRAFMFYSDEDNSFFARLFYERNDQIEAAEASGLSNRIREAVRDELVSVGRGERNALSVVCEFDSHESVVESCDGDYLTYLH